MIQQMKKFPLYFLIGATSMALGQQKDKAVYKQYEPGYYENSILKGIEEFQKKEATPKAPSRRFKMDYTGVTIPNDPAKYKSFWYNDPISQGNTSTCWCFSTTSFFESEAFRLSGQKVKLSEMYPVYWEYIERAKLFVKERGNMLFAEGSESNAVTRSYKIYGTVPMDAYPGLKEGQQFHTHAKMFAELDGYLKNIKATNAWNEEQVVNTVKSILNNYLGQPPATVTVNGKKITPQEYLKNNLKINVDDYVEVMSLMSEPYYTKSEYKVPDNWWHSKDYHNVPLEDFMSGVRNAIRGGYTISIGGDVSEPGFDPAVQAAMIPSFDIPAEYIDEGARQLRFNNGSTTDDHGVHLVGYMEQDGKDWYLIKDSGAGSRNCGKDSKCFGYYFFHEDYVKLKMMTYTVHKDAVKDVLSKFK